jgi:hypothetical protein
LWLSSFLLVGFVLNGALVGRNGVIGSLRVAWVAFWPVEMIDFHILEAGM